VTALAALSGTFLTLSPVGFRLIDDMSGQAPIGLVRCKLEVSDGAGAWVPTGIVASRSLGGIVIFPGLGRVARRGLAEAQSQRYRAGFDAEFYRPQYRVLQEGLEFDVAPYNDAEPPPGLNGVPLDVVLVPASNFPFPPELRVLRGTVRFGSNAVSDAEVSRGNVDRTLTDARGEYALPLRLPPLTGQITIDATDHRTGRVGHVDVNLPGALGIGQPIAIQ
jgi:hypothetical protein